MLLRLDKVIRVNSRLHGKIIRVFPGRPVASWGGHVCFSLYDVTWLPAYKVTRE